MMIFAETVFLVEQQLFQEGYEELNVCLWKSDDYELLVFTSFFRKNRVAMAGIERSLAN